MSVLKILQVAAFSINDLYLSSIIVFKAGYPVLILGKQYASVNRSMSGTINSMLHPG
jgi:hypothetical protein